MRENPFVIFIFKVEINFDDYNSKVQFLSGLGKTWLDLTGKKRLDLTAVKVKRFFFLL